VGGLSQAVGVRVLRRLSSALEQAGTAERVCHLFPELEKEILDDLNRAVKRKAYVIAAQQANELVFLSMAQNELCVKRRASKEKPPFVAHGG